MEGNLTKRHAVMTKEAPNIVCKLTAMGAITLQFWGQADFLLQQFFNEKKYGTYEYLLSYKRMKMEQAASETNSSVSMFSWMYSLHI
jgi:hypothetical protein